MAPSARRIAYLIAESINLLQSPTSVQKLILEVGVSEAWFPERTFIEDYAERRADAVLRELTTELDRRTRLGQASNYAFNSSSGYLVQGASYTEPADSQKLREAKFRRLQHAGCRDLLQSLTPRQFEGVCRGIIVAMGASSATLTRSSKDQGVDFFGRLSLQGKLAQSYPLPAIDRRLEVWLVGQAKHYQNVKVATPDIRELVGSVQLARSRVSSDTGQALAGLNMRLCDPVFYLFFTTGSISRDGWTLIDRSGVIGMDGESLAAFLADSEWEQILMGV